MSGKSAAEITAILDVSISKVQEIVEESKKSVDKILESSKTKTNEGLRIASECSDVLEKIVVEVDQFVDMSEKISIASTEQAKGINEIAKAMGNIDQSTNETSVLSNKAKTISDELEIEINTISSMIPINKKLTPIIVK